MRIAALVPAAGMGKRLDAGYNKQYIQLAGIPMVVRSIQVLADNPRINEIIWIVGADEIELASQLKDEFGLDKVTRIVAGGEERIHSVLNGRRAIAGDADYLLVHDGARPLITGDIIDRAIDQAMVTGSAVVAVPVKDTIKVINPTSKEILETPSRDSLWAAQTPQIVRTDWYDEAMAWLDSQGAIDWVTITDDVMLMELIGRTTAVSMGSYENIKVTTKDDVVFAESILRERQK